MERPRWPPVGQGTPYHTWRESAHAWHDHAVKLERRQKSVMTTVTALGLDEAYCDWWMCDECGCRGIHNSEDLFQFCPGCGRKIDWKIGGG